MSQINNQFYWIGERIAGSANNEFIYVQGLNELPLVMGGVLCINQSDASHLEDLLQEFYQVSGRWSWCVFVTKETPYTRCVTDGLFDKRSAQELRKEMQRRLSLIHRPEMMDSLVGWLGVNRNRAVRPLKSLTSASIYSYPIIDVLFPDLRSPYRYVLSEQNRGVLHSEELVDRIRVCSHCNSGHLNYVEVCPDCSSIDIETQSSLHCFTCGHVGSQSSFQRRGSLECPNCLSKLRHIGVDYDRPLENHICNSCSGLFVEAATMTQCLSCDDKSKVEQLVARNIHQFRLGESGEFMYRNGKPYQAPELSIKGKVDLGFFQNVVAWVNKVALRHHEEHLLLGLHLPSLNEYGKQYGELKLFSLMEQLTERMSSMFRDTDICCQFRQDTLLVLTPHTSHSNLPALQQKLSEISALIEDDELELNVFAWGLPQAEIENGVTQWLENLAGDISAAR